MTSFAVKLLTVTGDVAEFRMHATDEYQLRISLAVLGIGPERIVEITAVSA